MPRQNNVNHQLPIISQIQTGRRVRINEPINIEENPIDFLTHYDGEIAKEKNPFQKSKQQCCVCKKTFTIYKKFNIQGSNYFYCAFCLRKKGEVCCKCNSLYPSALIKHFSYNNDILVFCSYCYKNEIISCRLCSQKTFKEKVLGGADGFYYCKKCWLKKFNYCYRCHKSSYKEDLRIEGESGKLYCNECWIKYHLIHDYSYQPRYKMNKCLEETSSTLFMGLELEVEHNKTPEIVATQFLEFLKTIDMEKFIYFKYDASVRGFEIVTHPFSLKYITTNMQIPKILNWLEENGFKVSARCGLHFHLDNEFLTKDNRVKMRIFISKYQDNIFEISGRQNKNNEFCVYEVYELRYFKEIGLEQDGRHWAYNCDTDKRTSEIRMFNGTLDTNKFFGALQFAHSLANYVKTISLHDFEEKNTDYYDLWESYIKLVNGNKNYKELIELLKE